MKFFEKKGKWSDKHVPYAFTLDRELDNSRPEPAKCKLHIRMQRSLNSR